MRSRPMAAALLVGVLVGSLPLGLSASATADADADLHVFFEKDSREWRHVRMHQTLDGLRILDAGMTRHASLDGSMVVEQRDLVPVDLRLGAHVLGEQAARAAAVRETGDAAVARAATPAWLPDAGGVRAVYDVQVASGAADWRVVVDGVTGATIRVQPESLQAVESGRVFNVNPIVATQDADLRDNRLSIDDGSFAGAYLDVEVASVTGPRLESPRVAIVDALATADEPSGYSFDRADPRFLETMVYYYVELALDRVAAVGYADMLDYQIQARAHHPVFQSGLAVFPAIYPDAYAGNGQISFIYRALTPGGPGFGSGAEDAEIIVHELGHLLHFAAAPEAAGGWRYIWGEGSGDFLAAVLLEPESQGFGDPCISEWLATYYEGVIELFEHEGLLCIRVLENDLRMPDDFFGDLTYQWAHENGQFWSGALWDIRKEIGREEALALFLESLYFMPTEADGFEDLGTTVLLADLGLTGGERETIIREAFAKKGIMLPTLLELQEAGVVTLAASEQDAAPTQADAAIPAPTIGLLVAVIAGAALARRGR